MSEQFDNLEKKLSELSENISTLENRLYPIVHQSPSAGLAKAAVAALPEPPERIVGLASRMKGNVEKLHEIDRQIRSILDRIEL